jgi:hypothetical protein
MKRSKKKKPLSEKLVASDEKLRDELRNFDLRKFDKALDRAVNVKRAKSG